MTEKMTNNYAVNLVLTILYGKEARNKAVHSTLVLLEPDRYGTFIMLILLDGTHISGRISRKHLFNGTVNGKKYKSYRLEDWYTWQSL